MWNVRSVVRGSSWLVATVSAFAIAMAIVVATHHARHTKRIDGKLAIQDLVRAYTDNMNETLADLYMSQSKSAEAIYVYQELIKTSPNNNHVCKWQYNVTHAQLWMAGANNGDTVTQIENLVRLSSKNVLPAAERKECHDNAAAMAGELARAFHSEAARTKSAETFGYAQRLYEVYLEAFPDAEDFAQTQYFYAELLWSRAEIAAQPQGWENAASAFTEVVKTHGVNAKLMRESAYAAVLGWKNALNIEPRAEEHPVTRTRDQLTIPDSTRKLLAAIDAYITVINDPNDDDAIGVKFIAANTYRRYNHFDEAIALCEDILAHHVEHETAEYAATLLVEILDVLGRHDEMDATIDALLASPKFLGGKSDPWLVALRDKGLLANFR
jgi:tetratricopeptide (TPR) repeat protein